jgi:hypothetical protein
MSKQTWFSNLYWRHFAGPSTDRELHRLLLTKQFSSVLELGIGSGARTQRVLKLLKMHDANSPIRYTVVDAFESVENHLSLKQAHKMFAEAGVKSSLVPGDLVSALARVGSTLGPHDLVIAEGLLDPTNPQQSVLWPWLKRIASPTGSIASSTLNGGKLVVVNCSDLFGNSGRIAA